MDAEAATGEPVGRSPLVIEGLTVSAATETGRYQVVDDISIRLQPGRVLGVAGESGSGKTVTALAAMRLLDPGVLRVDAGTIMSNGVDVLSLDRAALRRLRGGQISMIFQEPMTSLDPMFTVGSGLVETLRSHRKISRADAHAVAIELLDRVGIPDPATRVASYPFELSGGMRQRVMIAMAIACEPAALIADEPTTALDVTVQAQVMQLLRQLADEGMAIMLVTHDMGVISEYTDDLAVMYAGQIVEEGPTAEVLADPIHPYTAALLDTVPSPDERLDELPPIEGSVPPIHDMPSGCRFAPRCAHAAAQCADPVALTPSAALRTVRCVRAGELVLESSS